jgi:hypothetical protein
MTITNTAHTKIKNYFRSMIKEGRYTVGGVTKSINIFQIDQNGDKITVYLYLNDQIAGSITKYQLIDVDGDIFDDEPESITKTDLQGVLVAFRYSIQKVTA